jgi:hypothetical protein
MENPFKFAAKCNAALSIMDGTFKSCQHCETSAASYNMCSELTVLPPPNPLSCSATASSSGSAKIASANLNRIFAHPVHHLLFNINSLLSLSRSTPVNAHFSLSIAEISSIINAITLAKLEISSFHLIVEARRRSQSPRESRWLQTRPKTSAILCSMTTTSN